MIASTSISQITQRTLRFLVVALVLAPSFAWAANDDCTWLPDLRCEREGGRYEGFVMPMADPYIFEDPFITTGISVWGLWQEFPNNSIFGGGTAVSGDGGDAWAIAIQARLAITDRLAFIATKDGYTFLNPGADAVYKETDGFMNIAAGFKYALIEMPEDNFILSPSLRVEVPVGQDQVFQGYGSGAVIPAVSAAWGSGDFHLIGDLGGQIPFDTKKQSTSFFYHLHLDYAVMPFFVPLIELSGMHWTGSGRGNINATNTKLGFDPTLTAAQGLLGTGDFEGGDLINLGSQGVGGNDTVKLAVGARFPLTDNESLGAVYEFPLTHRNDIERRRVWMNRTLEY
jgi:hypothetical protein